MGADLFFGGGAETFLELEKNDLLQPLPSEGANIRWRRRLFRRHKLKNLYSSNHKIFNPKPGAVFKH